MRWLPWFKNELLDAPKRNLKITRETVAVDVGVTTISVTFTDGREVYSKIHGNIEHNYASDEFYINRFPYHHEWKPFFWSSQTKYRQLLQNFSQFEPTKVFDDDLNPTVAWTGIVQHIEIVKTEKFEQIGTIVRVTEVQDDSLREGGSS